MAAPDLPTGYLIHLRPLPDDGPAIIRLRKFLKMALRAFGFRCVSVTEVPPGKAASAAGADADAPAGPA